MMQQFINAKLLTQLGIQLSHEDQASLIEHLQDTLEERVGQEVMLLLDEHQVEELSRLQDSNDDAAFNQWLVENVPDLGDIIQDELDILVGQLAENGHKLVKQPA